MLFLNWGFSQDFHLFIFFHGGFQGSRAIPVLCDDDVDAKSLQRRHHDFRMSKDVTGNTDISLGFRFVPALLGLNTNQHLDILFFLLVG